jgi:hypothetical protein
MMPGARFQIKQVGNPNVFRAGWHQGHCEYLDNTQKIDRMSVGLDEFGYLYTGAAPQLPVVDFVEQ